MSAFLGVQWLVETLTWRRSWRPGSAVRFLVRNYPDRDETHSKDVRLFFVFFFFLLQQSVVHLVSGAEYDKFFTMTRSTYSIKSVQPFIKQEMLIFYFHSCRTTNTHVTMVTLLFIVSGSVSFLLYPCVWVTQTCLTHHHKTQNFENV